MIPFDVPWDEIDGVDPGQPNDVPVCEEVVPNKLVVRFSGYVRNVPPDTVPWYSAEGSFPENI